VTDSFSATFRFGGGELAATLTQLGARPAYLNLILWGQQDSWELLLPGADLHRSLAFPAGLIEAWLTCDPLTAALRAADLHQRFTDLHHAIGDAVYSFPGDKEAELDNIAGPICAHWSGRVPELTA
jgi:hypothetical protein